MTLIWLDGGSDEYWGNIMNLGYRFPRLQWHRLQWHPAYSDSFDMSQMAYYI